MSDEKFVPYIPPEQNLPDLTIKAIILGIVLAFIMGAANAYLGLYVGMTVSAAIPAAVMAMTILRPFKGTILEFNVVNTMAAAGEGLAAGVIFTIPALLVIGMWGEIHWMETTAAAFIGGILGVFFTIPLRRILIVDMNLPFPEGVACSEVLKVGEKGGSGLYYVFSAFAVGGLFKLMSSWYGFRLFQERVETIIGNGNSRLMMGMNVSPALVGVGYILGLNACRFIFFGGVIGWIILIPMAGAIYGFPAYDITGHAYIDFLNEAEGITFLWRSYTMYTGIGMIVIGGIWTLITMRGALWQGIQHSMAGAKAKREGLIRTERDFPMQWWFYIIIGVGTFALYWSTTKSGLISGVATGAMFLFAFMFTAIAGYLAGVIGSSNNPISGVTVCTLLFTGLLLMALGASGNAGITATIIVAAVICCSAAIAGDCMQNMKTGHILGSTPRSLQIAELIGVTTIALSIAMILGVMHEVYGIGTRQLPAPQAYVMGGMVEAVFNKEIEIAWFALGAFMAIFCIVFNEFAKRIGKESWSIPIMAVAIGIYLPFPLTLPIFVGGLMGWYSVKYIEKNAIYPGTTEAHESLLDGLKERANSVGTLFASGLIAGEALMGVIIAVIVLSGIDVTMIGLPSSWPGLLLFIYVIFFFFYLVTRETRRHKRGGPLSEEPPKQENGA